MRRAVCVSAQSSNDWALLVTAVQEDEWRRIIPMIWISGSSLIGAESPDFEGWRRAKQVRVLPDSHFTSDERKTQLSQMIKGAVESVAREYHESFFHRDTPSVLTASVLNVIGRFKKLPNFESSHEAAYTWFLEHKELAMRAHNYLRYLALGDSGSIPALTDLTQPERARLEENFLLYGDQQYWRRKK